MLETKFYTDIELFVNSPFYIGNMEKQAGYISEITKEGDKYLCKVKLFNDIDESIIDSLMGHGRFSFGYRVNCDVKSDSVVYSNGPIVEET